MGGWMHRNICQPIIGPLRHAVSSRYSTLAQSLTMEEPPASDSTQRPSALIIPGTSPIVGLATGPKMLNPLNCFGPGSLEIKT